jgi:hypothetical protein
MIINSKGGSINHVYKEANNRCADWNGDHAFEAG